MLTFEKVKKIFALFLSFLMLSSQVGFAISTHFCGGEISGRAISLVGSELGCGMEAIESSCSIDINNAKSVSEKSCCDDESEVFQLRENFNKKQSKIEVDASFLKVFLAITSLLFEIEEDKENYTKLSSPPLIQKNTQVLFQTFLL